ncbi:hypothetical protein KIW84_060858 [Lathyrus oleraceus]|uniref:FLZ-type domain-containing protein n=3 Tax=Pisum sativum TaxID=3888 RepID=A0A9D4W0T2_PEA|nr:hypothetical protein KIW84_060858 [Pisum sativum]
MSACESYDNFVYNTQNKVEKESEIVPNSQFTSLSTNTSLTFLIILFLLHFNFISPNHFSLIFLQHTFIKPRCEMALGSNEKRKSILNVRLGMDSDSLRSPTSPLDVTLLSNRGNPLRTISPDQGQKRGWDCTKVGLSIIDSLDDCSKFSRNVLLSSEFSKGSSLSPNHSPQMITKVPNVNHCLDSVKASKSLPKDFFKLPYTRNSSVFRKGESNVVFEIGETLVEHELPFGKSMSCSLDCYGPIKDYNFDDSKPVSSRPCFIGENMNPNMLLPMSLSASEIENSEDYTCVISHGPNPKKTHIFCDCILEVCAGAGVRKLRNENEEKEGLFPAVVDRLETPKQYPSAEFLAFCNGCNKKFEEGKDIYIYRGEKAFCSLTCRAFEIMIDEELEKSNAPPSENSIEYESGGEVFGSGIFTAE